MGMGMGRLGEGGRAPRDGDGDARGRGQSTPGLSCSGRAGSPRMGMLREAQDEDVQEGQVTPALFLAPNPVCAWPSLCVHPKTCTCRTPQRNRLPSRSAVGVKTFLRLLLQLRWK